MNDSSLLKTSINLGLIGVNGSPRIMSFSGLRCMYEKTFCRIVYIYINIDKGKLKSSLLFKVWGEDILIDVLPKVIIY